MEPHTYNSPSLVNAAEQSHPQHTSTITLCLRAHIFWNVKMFFCSILPFPVCPLSFNPQEYIRPSLSKISVCPAPPTIFLMLSGLREHPDKSTFWGKIHCSDNVPCPNWPWEFAPYKICPSYFIKFLICWRYIF